MQDATRRTNADRRAATRAALLKAARKLFVSKGYAETGTPEIVQAAKVTRGALYHHFRDKADLFAAVAMQEADAVARRIAREAPASLAPSDALAAGAEAYFHAMSKSGRARLLLIEAPAVLDANALRALSAASGEAELRAGLAALAQGKVIPLDALTSLLSAMFDRAALDIARGADAGDYISAMRHLLDRLAA